jgi:hypothetical protein
VIHESLLTTYSDFFRAALTGGFVEAEEKVVKLEEDRSQTFVFFVHWLYHQRLPDRSKGDADEIVKPWSFKTDAAKKTTPPRRGISSSSTSSATDTACPN